MMYNFSVLICVAFCYFYLHWQYFSFVGDCLNQPNKNRRLIVTSIVNYVMFTVCSVLQVHLILNWSLFFLILWIEIWLIYRITIISSMCFALFGVMMGLASNILSRCLVALAWNKPLQLFDSHVLIDGNLKRYPIILGFLLSGLIFHLFRKFDFSSKIKSLLKDRTSIRFLMMVSIVLYAYLVLNLLTYYTDGNSVVMKFWGIKSALFAELGFFLSVFYCARMSRINYYREMNRRERKNLLRDKQEEEQIRLIAYLDPLTGCLNRHRAEEVLNEFWDSGRPFCLCFADLDGLKTVNDQYGHFEGDQYLKSAAEHIQKQFRAGDFLFRYGGDEFLILSDRLTPEAVSQRIQQVNLEMAQGKSISYGTAVREEAQDLSALLHLVDQRMYQNKMKGRGSRND